MRLELEFEQFNDDRMQALDVEEVRKKQLKMRKSYNNQQDEYTSAHIKAGRMILEALKRLRAKKRLGEANTIEAMEQTVNTLSQPQSNAVAMVSKPNRFQEMMKKSTEKKMNQVGLMPIATSNRNNNQMHFISNNSSYLNNISEEEKVQEDRSDVSGMIREFEEQKNVDNLIDEEDGIVNINNEVPSNMQQAIEIGGNQQSDSFQRQDLNVQQSHHSLGHSNSYTTGGPDFMAVNPKQKTGKKVTK